MKRSIAVLVFIYLSMYSIADACSVCFGDPNSPLTKSMGWGIWTLMGFIGFVLILLSVLFWKIRQRIKKISTAQPMNKYNTGFNAC
jgi:hypothetical protein